MKQVLITDRKDSCDKMLGYTCHPGVRSTIGSMLFAIALCLTACGGDSSTSVNDDESSSSAIQSSSGVTLSGTSAKSNGSSSSTKKSSSSRMDSIGSSSLQNDSKSSSSKTVILSSSSAKTTSSSVILSSSEGSSNSTPKSSSSVIPDSVPGSASSSSKTDSGTSAGMTSSSEYVPFDHSKTHANASKVGKDAYKQFTDPRNGRSYYYITITSVYSGDSVTVMAENLNIGEMVLGKDDQNNDAKIERYCYNNDTTLCDEFGGLYQWAEMMQLPSRCNTESCSDLIQENHRGICPEGWRLMTYDDFVVIEGYKDEFGYGIKGLRSAYGFGGNNYSGFSLTGAGMRTPEGGFADLRSVVYWFYPEEHEYDVNAFTHAAYVASAENIAGTSRNQRSDKIVGNSVRCVKVEQ